MPESLPMIYLARHGETAWTVSRRHTGQTDIPLTERGERNSLALAARLRGAAFAAVLTSPLQRARRTCELAGLGATAEVLTDLQEWDYGAYEGLTTAEIRRDRPDWDLFRDGCSGGESVAAVAARADRVIARVRAIGGPVILFGHGHSFRVLAARWIGEPAGEGRYYLLGTASLSILGYEHSLHEPVIRLWNDDRHVGE